MLSDNRKAHRAFRPVGQDEQNFKIAALCLGSGGQEFCSSCIHSICSKKSVFGPWCSMSMARSTPLLRSICDASTCSSHIPGLSWNFRQREKNCDPFRCSTVIFLKTKKTFIDYKLHSWLSTFISTNRMRKLPIAHANSWNSSSTSSFQNVLPRSAPTRK